jgi:dTDP-4-dehydrorhamnose reductase
MTHVLITGASGLLGSNVVRESSQACNVTAVVYQNPLEFERVDVEKVDLTDAAKAKAVIFAAKPDWVIHCAADTAIDELESAQERAQLANVDMTRNVARASAEIGAQMLFVSTDSVFSGRDGPYSEIDKPEPINVYAQSKLDGENAAVEEHPGPLIVRTNLFGWGQGKKLSLAEWFYSNLKEDQPVPGFIDVHFSPIYASELARLFLRMLQEGLQGLYHLAGAKCVSKFEFGVRLAQTFGYDPSLVQPVQSGQKDWQAKRPKNTCLDGSKLAGELGIELPELDDGLAHFKADLNEATLMKG